MVVTQDTYWSVDDVPLNTLGYNISTGGGSMRTPPPMIGSNVPVPHAPGDRFVAKKVGSRIITFQMWVVGADEDGNIPTTLSGSRKFDENWRKLVNLLWTPGRQVKITKRFWADGQIRTAIGYGQYAGGLSPSMTGRTRAVFTVDLEMTDPYFYTAERTQSLTNGTLALTVLGDADTRRVKLNMQGSRTNGKVRNATLNVDVEYRAALNTGEYVDLDAATHTATTKPSGAAFNSIGYVVHTGDPFWMVLRPGANSIVTSSASGTGVVSMVFQEAWL